MGWGGTTNSIVWRKCRQQYENGPQSVTLDPKTKKAYSYQWWCFLTMIKGKLVFNNYYYSAQTTAHQSCVKDVLKELKIKIDIEVSTESCLEHLNGQAHSSRHTVALEPVYQRIFELELKIENARNDTDAADYQIEILDEQITISELRSLGAKFSRTDQRYLKASVIKRRLNDIAHRKERNEKRKIARNEAKKAIDDFSAVQF